VVFFLDGVLSMEPFSEEEFDKALEKSFAREIYAVSEKLNALNSRMFIKVVHEVLDTHGLKPVDIFPKLRPELQDAWLARPIKKRRWMCWSGK